MSIPHKVSIAEQQRYYIDQPGVDKFVTYEQFVCNLIKKMPTDKEDLIHMVLGIGGEGGEIIDAVKKHSVYGKDLDRENIVEELGDLEFYMSGLRQMLGISRQEVIMYNVKKLGKRYSGGYSDAAAIARADKEPVPETPADGPDERMKGAV